LASSSIASAPDQRAGNVGDHEGAGGERDGVFRILLVGAPAREHDLARDLHAFADHGDVAAGGRRPQIVDPQVERRDAPHRAVARRARRRQCRTHRHAAGLVEHAGDRPAMDHAGIGVAHQMGAIGQAHHVPARPGFDDHRAQRGEERGAALGGHEALQHLVGNVAHGSPDGLPIPP